MAIRRLVPLVLLGAASLAVFSACSSGTRAEPGNGGAQAPSLEVSLPPTSALPPTGALPPTSALPPTNGLFDYQLGGAYEQVRTESGDVGSDVVVRDSQAEPLPGAYNICYVNGFQTQPGQQGEWLEGHGGALLRDTAGEPVVDPEWPDEYVLDPSTPDQREEILLVVGPMIDACVEKGYSAVEIDNLDTWTRFPGIDEAGALELARDYTERAHEAGLAVGQKNAAEIAEVAKHELGFDFAIAEECAAWEECSAYTAVYGEHVLQIEYPDSLVDAGMTFEDVCGLDSRAPLTILRDRDLVTREGDGYVYSSC